MLSQIIVYKAACSHWLLFRIFIASFHCWIARLSPPSPHPFSSLLSLCHKTFQRQPTSSHAWSNISVGLTERHFSWMVESLEASYICHAFTRICTFLDTLQDGRCDFFFPFEMFYVRLFLFYVKGYLREGICSYSQNAVCCVV